MTSLNIVAHPDDDLLFLNSDIAEEIEGNNQIVTVYATAGDDGNGAEYIYRRRMASGAAYRYAGKPSHLRTLLFLGVRSSCFREGDIDGDLSRMWNHATHLYPSVDNKNLSGFGMVEEIRNLIEYYKPDIIRTHNPNVEPALTHDEPHLDHVDHIYTAKFVQEAAKVFPLIPVYAYMGYPIRYQSPNLTEHQTQLKTTMWRAYQSVDTSVSGNIWDVALDKCYKERIQ